tara:strand:+ start:5112 stop:6701 length:1590 start_codon:yes stop_codon:yes gene_type:complete
MAHAHVHNHQADHVVVIGAGMAGLAAAARLAHAGCAVTVLESHAIPGGKIRSLPSPAGPVDTGPTVLTLRPVFDALFRSLGERLEDHLHLVRQTIIARHFWPDGSTLDLHDTADANTQAIRDFAGDRAARQFQRFDRRARTLFQAFDRPVMQAARPSLSALTLQIARDPRVLGAMAPFSTLAGLLGATFDDPRLVQLFGRYATYVGGSPHAAPALLSLIWHAEASGVWAIDGGMEQLAKALEAIATDRGAKFHYETHVDQIEVRDGAVTGVTLETGQRIPAEAVLFNGDPRALATGALGPACSRVAQQTHKAERSLSADVWAFAARPTGPDLSHHNVFFNDAPKDEFAAMTRGTRAPSPTLYVCAMDRGLGRTIPPVERFEIIANAPPQDGRHPPEETQACQARTFQTLAGFGLRFDPMPEAHSLSTPHTFNRLFPQSEGSLYGQSPHGLMAAFRRPTARTRVRGLYLAGGGTHPGAGLPMATLSARHAAEAILNDRTSTSPSRPTATHGGMSTGSGPTAAAPSASSDS